MVASDITRFFNADFYNENGYQSAVSTSSQIEIFPKEGHQNIYKQISKTTVGYYNFHFLDTSAISLVDFSTEFTNYSVERTSSRRIESYDLNPTYDVLWVQATEQYQETWAVESIDIVLGLVGGFSGILWSLLAMVFGGYETFKLENSLIGSIYPTSPHAGEESRGADFIESETKARSEMMKIIAERGKYFYSYTDYLVSSLARTFCGCCCSTDKQDGWFSRRMRKLERHE